MSSRSAHDNLHNAIAAADIPTVLACQVENARQGMLCGGIAVTGILRAPTGCSVGDRRRGALGTSAI